MTRRPASCVVRGLADLRVVGPRACTGDIPASHRRHFRAAELADGTLATTQSHRFSLLDQITPANVKNLKLQWVYQSPWLATGRRRLSSSTASCTSPNGRMTSSRSMRSTGRAFWIYRYTPNPNRIVCCGANNRGVAILGDTLFMGTLDAQPDCHRREERAPALEDRSGDHDRVTRSRTRRWSSRTK